MMMDADDQSTAQGAAQGAPEDDLAAAAPLPSELGTKTVADEKADLAELDLDVNPDVGADTERRVERISERTETLVTECEETRLMAALAASALMRAATSKLYLAEYEQIMGEIEQGLLAMDRENDVLDRRIDAVMRRSTKVMHASTPTVAA